MIFPRFSYRNSLGSQGLGYNLDLPGWREPWHLLLAAISILCCKRKLLLHLSPSQSGEKALKLIMSATETEAELSIYGGAIEAATLGYPYSRDIPYEPSISGEKVGECDYGGP